MIKAIIIDLDGTTLPRNWHQISEEKPGCPGRGGTTRRGSHPSHGTFSVLSQQHATRRSSGGLHGIFLRGRHHALG